MAQNSAPRTNTFRFLSVDKLFDEWPLYYRIMVNDTAGTVKYLRLDPQYGPPADSAERPTAFFSYRMAFDTVPEGTWYLGHLLPSATSDKELVLTSTDATVLPGIDPSSFFHPCRVNLEDLLQGNPVGERWSHPQCTYKKQAEVLEGPHIERLTGHKAICAAWDWNPNEVLVGPGQDTYIYSLIDGHDIAPRFVGHITENKDTDGARAFGFMVEYMPDCRVAEAQDLEECKAVLRRLHQLGIVLGFLEPACFLVVDKTDGQKKVFLHGFGSASATEDQEEMDDEMRKLEAMFAKDVLEKEEHETSVGI
ncbi:hypothetical protein C8A01DRAFT_41941 [Parachaetomium inaequale]|uniref:Uncharacterized protein n=1 Tax=Parachaetomium inaequale TaxID=2588326 RepID=A0AAN6P4T9_9PEZI|nr:hypothetical protein C8A01DRAFT_41941 [Parachaetomium inaequale]